MVLGFIVIASRGATVELWMVCILVVALISFALIPNGSEGLGTQISAIRSHIFYAGAGLFVAVAIRSQQAIVKIVRFLMHCGLIIAIYGCIQFALRGVLPPFLLYPPDTDLFGYWGTDLTRSTGLVGNVIVFGTLLTLIFSLWVAKFLWCPNPWSAVACLIIAAGVLSTLSRMAIASCAVILVALVFTAFVSGRFRLSPVVLTASSLAIAALGILVASNSSLHQAAGQSFLWQDLFLGNNASVAKSTDSHFMFQEMALDSFHINPLVGTGIGTQSFDSANAQSQQVITDGFWLATIVEGGLVLLVPTVMLFAALLVRLVAASRQVDSNTRYLPLAVLAYLVSQVLAAGFFNTGFYGKTPNVIFWITFGLAAAAARIKTDDSLSGSKGRTATSANMPKHSGLSQSSHSPSAPKLGLSRRTQGLDGGC